MPAAQAAAPQLQSAYARPGAPDPAAQTGPQSFGVGVPQPAPAQVGRTPLVADPSAMTGPASFGSQATGAPVAPPAAPPDPYAAYKGAFQQYYDAAQAQINAGLQQSLAGLGQRRDAASQVVAALPGQIKRQFATVQGIGQNVGAPSDAAIGQQTMGAQQAAGVSIDPLAAAAVQANATAGTTALNQQAMAGTQQLLQDRFQYLQSLAQQQMNNPKGLSQADLAAQSDQRQLSNQKELAQFNAGLNTKAAQAQPDPTFGKDGMTVGDVQTIRTSPSYKTIAGLVVNKQANWPQLQRVYAQNPSLLKVLAADFPALITDKGMSSTLKEATAHTPLIGFSPDYRVTNASPYSYGK